MPRAKVSKKAQAIPDNLDGEIEVGGVNGVENLKKSRAKAAPVIVEPIAAVNGKPKGRGSKKTKSQNDEEAEVKEEVYVEPIKEVAKTTPKEKTNRRKAQREEVAANGDHENVVTEEPKVKGGRGGRKVKAAVEVVVEKNTEKVHNGKQTVESKEALTPKKPKSGRREKKIDLEQQNGNSAEAPIVIPANNAAVQVKGRRKKEPVAPETEIAVPSPGVAKPSKVSKTVKTNDNAKPALKRGRTKVQEDIVSKQEEQQETAIEESPKKKMKMGKEKGTADGAVALNKKSRTKKNDDQNSISEVAVEPEMPKTLKGKGDSKKSSATAPKNATGRKRVAAKSQTVTTEDDNQEDEEEDGAKPPKSKKPLMNSTETTYNKSDFELPSSITVDGNTSNASNNGLEHQRTILKISSWNVAGLRSWVKKDGLKFLEYEEPDIFCLQEIKCTTEQLPEEATRIPGYHPYWLCLPGGYAGVALYSKIMPINVEYGIGNDEFDSAGRLITAEYEKFYLINVYVPNSGRKLVNLEARMRWEKLFQAHVKKFDALKPVIICGDMNVSHQEIDLANPKSNTRSAGFTKEEREKMTELLALGYVDTFRDLYPDKRGAYTYWTYMSNARARNVGWRLDYFIVSDRILKRVLENAIRSQCMGSDHCPITLFINI